MDIQQHQGEAVETAGEPEAVGDGNVTILRDGDRTFYIVGTAHVSEASVREVESVIEAVQPDTVCVELCKARYEALTDEDRWKKLDIFKVIRQGKTLFLLANLAIGAYQRRIGAKLGVKPGAELLAGAKKGEEIGAHIELVDRDIHTTLKRTWGNLGFFRKMTLLAGIMGSLTEKQEDGKELTEEEEIEQLKMQANLSEMMKEFADALPEVHGPLIDERDQYLISHIEKAPGKTIVAVVGAGHVPGMKGYFKKDIDTEPLDVIPERNRLWGLLKWIIPTLILIAFYKGYTDTAGQSLTDMLYAWIIPNSIMCGLLCALAGAKFLSIVTGFVASPITSLNPLLGAGMVVGLLEAWLRKPTVEDAERINDDVQSIKGIYKNPFTRVLLVAVAATLGSALGAWVGFSWVLTLAV